MIFKMNAKNTISTTQNSFKTQDKYYEITTLQRLLNANKKNTVLFETKGIFQNFVNVETSFTCLIDIIFLSSSNQTKIKFIKKNTHRKVPLVLHLMDLKTFLVNTISHFLFQ